MFWKAKLKSFCSDLCFLLIENLFSEIWQAFSNSCSAQNNFYNLRNNIKHYDNKLFLIFMQEILGFQANE